MADRLQPEEIEAVGRIWRLADREVWIVTASHNERRGGLLATWVSPVTLDPAEPLMLATLAPNHFTAELVEGGGGFTLHLLATHQTELAWNFALGSGRERDKLAGLEVRESECGPILAAALTWMECRVVARLATADRTYFWGRVVSAGPPPGEPPLREQAFIASANDEQRRRLIAERDADIGLHAPLRAEWLANLPEWLRP